jgi:two-component system chemotaxis sensor kinase CheA
MALPLSSVSRLEEFPRSALERVGPQNVVQYRDEILPLLDVSQLLRQRRRRARNQQFDRRRRATHDTAVEERSSLPVVVCTNKGQRVGLVVDRILDIAEETLVSRGKAHRPGVLFTAVIQGRVTEFLDVNRILRSVDPDVLEPAQTIAVEA